MAVVVTMDIMVAKDVLTAHSTSHRKCNSLYCLFGECGAIDPGKAVYIQTSAWIKINTLLSFVTVYKVCLSFACFVSSNAHESGPVKLKMPRRRQVGTNVGRMIG